MTRMRPGRTFEWRAIRIDDREARERVEQLAVEEPLELRLEAGTQTRRVGVTMRTPGNDFELAAGYFFSEGVISTRDDIDGIAYCTDPGFDEEQRYNAVTVRLRSAGIAGARGLERHVLTSSACGVCGRDSIDGLLERCRPVESTLRVEAKLLESLPERMRGMQRVFEATGGLHAAALFDRDGEILVVREDVGRHNALDKTIGWALLQNRIPLGDAIATVSGRASFELVQKAAAAGIPVLCAVSAPSSLAASLAGALGVTLAGFVREGRCTVYTHAQRILTHGAAQNAGRLR